MFQATLLWRSLSSSMRPMERNASSKCWTSFKGLPGSTITQRAAVIEQEGSTSPPAAPPPTPCWGPTFSPAETSIVWVQECLCGGFDQCIVEEKFYVWRCTVDMTTMRMLCGCMRQYYSDRQRSKRQGSAGSPSTQVTPHICCCFCQCCWYCFLRPQSEK